MYDFLDNEGIEYLVMEVSSQGISEGRVLGLEFDVIAYTNITQDHLDYHKTMDNYAHVKSDLLYYSKPTTTLILNKEMEYFDLLKGKSLLKTYTFSTKGNSATINSKIINKSLNGMEFEIDGLIAFTKLIGDFNLDNLTLVYSILKALGFKKELILGFFETITPVRGRMNVYKLNDRFIIIDYAHTPDGVSQVLKYMSHVKTGNILTVIGCGGNKDKSKRSIMGSITTSISDHVIFTSDNSRAEEFSDIVNDITKDLKCSNFEVIKSRSEAIDKAISVSSCGDIICILGKGAEEYIIEKEIIPFSDILYIESFGGVKL